MKGWCEDIFHLYCYSHDRTYFHLVLCSLLWYCEPRPVSQDVPLVGLSARCTGQGSPKYDLCMWFRAPISAWDVMRHPEFSSWLSWQDCCKCTGRGLSLPAYYGLGNTWLASSYLGVSSQPKSLFFDALLSKDLRSDNPCHFTFQSMFCSVLQ